MFKLPTKPSLVAGITGLALIACGDNPSSEDELDCPEESPLGDIYDDYTGTGPLPSQQVRVVSVDSEMADDTGGAAIFAVDGYPHSSWRTDPKDAFPHAIELSLGGSALVRGIRYLAAEDEPAIGEFSLYVATRPGCWGDPVASGRIAAADVAIPIDGKIGGFVRLEVHSAQDGSASVSAAEIEVLVAAGIVSQPPAYALVGYEYAYRVAADLPAKDPGAIRFELVDPPAGVEIDAQSGLLHWVPASDQEGDHSLTVRASDGNTFAEQSFVVHVATPLELVSKAIDAETGGIIEVADTGTSLDGMIVEIPPGALPADETITVALLRGTMPELWAEQTRVGEWFTLLPRFDEPIRLRVTMPVAPSSLPTWATLEDVRLMGFVPEPRRSGGKGGQVILVDTEGNTLPNAIVAESDWIWGTHLTSAATRFKRYDREHFVLYWALDPGAEPHDEEANAILDELETARAGMIGYGCETPAKTPAVVATFEDHKLMGLHAAGVIYMPANDTHPEERLETLAHEYFHAVQYRYTNVWGQGYWFTEATAVFMEDVLVDDGNGWHSVFGPWRGNITTAHLTASHPRSLKYQRALFFHHLATAGDFNACHFYRDHGEKLANGEGIAALQDALGDLDRWWLSFASGYNHIRRDDWIDEITELDMTFTVGHSTLEECNPGVSLVDDYVVAAVSAVVTAPADARRLTLRVASEGGYLVGVYGGDDWRLLNSLEQSPKSIVIDDPPPGDILVTYAANVTPDYWRWVSLTAEIGETATVIGSVREEDGTPVAGAPVKVTVAEWYCEPVYGVTDEDGWFRFVGVPIDKGLITVTTSCRDGDGPAIATISSPEPGEIDTGWLEIPGTCDLCKGYFGDSATACPESGWCADKSYFCTGIPVGCRNGCTDSNGNTTTEDEVYCFDGRFCADLTPVEGEYCDTWLETTFVDEPGYCPDDL